MQRPRFMAPVGAACAALVALVSAVLASVAPAESPAQEAAPGWTIRSLSRQCSVGNTSCSWNFTVENPQKESTPCSLTLSSALGVNPLRWRSGSHECGPYTARSVWMESASAGPDFTTIIVINSHQQLALFADVTDDELGKEGLAPDRSFKTIHWIDGANFSPVVAQVPAIIFRHTRRYCWHGDAKCRWYFTLDDQVSHSFRWTFDTSESDQIPETSDRNGGPKICSSYIVLTQRGPSTGKGFFTYLIAIDHGRKVLALAPFRDEEFDNGRMVRERTARPLLLPLHRRGIPTGRDRDPWLKDCNDYDGKTGRI